MEEQERPDNRKLTHREVDYERYSTHYREDCSRCSMVIKNANQTRCTLVLEPIFLGGWCREFERER